jgi:hypothetical protein
MQTYLIYGEFAAIWNLAPGSKSFSWRGTGGATPWYWVLRFHHSELYVSDVILPENTLQRHWSTRNANGTNATRWRACRRRKLMEFSKMKEEIVNDMLILRWRSACIFQVIISLSIPSCLVIVAIYTDRDNPDILLFLARYHMKTVSDNWFIFLSMWFLSIVSCWSF